MSQHFSQFCGRFLGPFLAQNKCLQWIQNHDKPLVRPLTSYLKQILCLGIFLLYRKSMGAQLDMDNSMGKRQNKFQPWYPRLKSIVGPKEAKKKLGAFILFVSIILLRQPTNFDVGPETRAWLFWTLLCMTFEPALQTIVNYGASVPKSSVPPISFDQIDKWADNNVTVHLFWDFNSIHCQSKCFWERGISDWPTELLFL